MITIDRQRTPADLERSIDRLFELSGGKIRALDRRWGDASGAPVFTVGGKYQARGWTDWTQGFQFGSALLQFDATGEAEFLELGRRRTLERMTPHLTHTGVHDHGFNTVSTYGALWRLAAERRLDASEWEVRLYELALKVSGAVQAARWTPLPGGGFIHSFNGAHSLFVDTIRSLRVLALAHALGHVLMAEQDARVSLLGRLVQHANATALFNVYYGRERDGFDVRGRVVHEAVFNVANGSFRNPGTHQGYSPFTTWTRGLAWAILGFAEQLEFLDTVADEALDEWGGRAAIDGWMLDAARATADYYITEAAAADGVPYWDTGAPGLRSAGRVGQQARGSVQRSRAGGQLCRRHCGAGPSSPRPRARATRRGRRRVRTGRPAHARCAVRSRWSVPGHRIRDTRACCCTPSITGRTAGTTCRQARAFPGASRVSGATTTRARQRCTCGVSRGASGI